MCLQRVFSFHFIWTCYTRNHFFQWPDGILWPKSSLNKFFMILLILLLGKKLPQKKSPSEKYEYGHLESWYNKSTLKQIFFGKIHFFVIRPFCTLQSIYINIGFSEGSFVCKYCVVNLVALLSTKKRYTIFFEKGFHFSENLLQN